MPISRKDAERQRRRGKDSDPVLTAGVATLHSVLVLFNGQFYSEGV